MTKTQAKAIAQPSHNSRALLISSTACALALTACAALKMMPSLLWG